MLWSVNPCLLGIVKIMQSGRTRKLKHGAESNLELITDGNLG